MIPNLTKRHENALVKVLKENWRNPGSKLKKLGYKPKKTGNFVSYAYTIYVHTKYKLVVKRPYLTGKKPKRAAPTKRLPNEYVVQVLCDTSRNAVNTAMAKIEWNGEYGWDVHEWNVGVYNGKPVVFDW